jgi:hypothetical protein
MPRHWAGSHARGTRPVPAGPTSSQTRRRPCGLTGGNPGSATDPTSGVAVGQTNMDTPVRRVTSVAKRSQAPRVPKVGVAGGHGGSARSPKGPPRAAVFGSMESYRHTGTAGPVNREAQSTLPAVPLAPEVEDRPGPLTLTPLASRARAAGRILPKSVSAAAVPSDPGPRRPDGCPCAR